MRATEFITLPLPEKEGLNEMIQIPMGRKGRAMAHAPAMLYHNLRGRDLGRDGSIQGYPISAREKELEELFPTPSPDGYVWLSLQPGYGGNDYITIDATKLDPANLRYTGQSEGFIIHKGSIPANAITLRRSNKWEGLLMKATEFLTESASGTLYHVTQTKNIPKIKAKGILMMQPTNWLQAGSKERYGSGDVFAFDHLADAVRWAAKWDWELFKNMGSGNISIVKFESPMDPWKVDDADPLSQASNKGRWLKAATRVTPNQILDIIPVTNALIKEMLM